ncbi:zinc finger BED domain-containing protein RICESLEEPER 2-like protein [Tanacetum coccineum]|uniref:Zinc finger BED domain-containing protein RICESLEEPER 2-like protein n=1 Tax=Tanacetum coccineum TaxID=301880 RepID=A0ABQ5IIT3_9ASTR
MASQSASTTQGAGSSSAPTVVQILPNNRNLQIFKDFNLCLMSDDTKKAQCIHCFHFFSKDSSSTSKNHISHPHCEALKRVSESGQSSMSQDGSIFVYNPDVLHEQFAGLVIQRGLPFNHFDDEQTTRVFQKHLQPKYNHVSRTTLKHNAIKLWVAAKQAIINGFSNLNTNVNLTTDVWSALHGLPDSYICVAAHWIEPGTWQMMKRVIAFEDFPVPYTGSALAKTLRNVFVNFKLENKIMSITLDNASNNTSAIGKLRLKYEPPMEGRFYHSRCVAHIINLCVQDGLAVKEINKIKESFKTMLKDVFKSGGKNQQRYSRICKQAGKPCLSPHWDVPTRWNSTYHMFLSGLKQRSTLMYFHDLLASKNRCHQFSAENWVIIEGLTQLLEVFNNATKILSGVYYPTSPLVLQQIVFMTTKLTYDGVTDLSVFERCSATKAKKWFDDSLEGFYNIYYVKYGNLTTESTSGGSSSKASGGGNQMTRLLNQLQEHRKKKARNDPSLSSEYERYVNSDFVTLLDNSVFGTFDLLGFWKAKELMYPVLSRMAMDKISVQATLVASESACSTSGRVLSIQRTRLTQTSLEMCMCLKDHLDAQERKQHKSGFENPIDFEEEILDAEMQQNEVIPLSKEEIALDVASSEGTMFGSGSRGEEVDYDMTNYGYDDYE